MEELKIREILRAFFSLPKRNSSGWILVLPLLLFGFVSTPSMQASEKKEEAKKIIWMNLDFPPSFIVKGKHKDEGYSNVATNIVIKALPEYEHEVRLLNPPQAIEHFKDRKNICAAGLNKNSEREEYMIFSNKPFISRFPNEVVVRVKDSDRFTRYLDLNNKINIQGLLSDRSFRLGYHLERSYHENIDGLLKRFAKNRNLIHRPAQDLTGGFLAMLEARRIDYIIESPESLALMLEDSGLENIYRTFPIKGADGMLDVYFACSYTDIGEEVIEKINSLIEEKKDEFMAGYMKWLNEESKERYEKIATKEEFSDEISR